MTFYFKISKLKFYVVLVLILLIPVSKNYRLLLFGVRTEGIATGCGENQPGAVQVNSAYTVFRFETGKGTYHIAGPENFVYRPGEKVKIIYDTQRPEKCMIFSFSYIYLGSGAIIPGVLLIVWIVIYTSFKKPRKSSGPRQKHSS